MIFSLEIFDVLYNCSYWDNNVPKNVKIELFDGTNVLTFPF